MPGAATGAATGQSAAGTLFPPLVLDRLAPLDPAPDHHDLVGKRDGCGVREAAEDGVLLGLDAIRVGDVVGLHLAELLEAVLVLEAAERSLGVRDALGVGQLERGTGVGELDAEGAGAVGVEPVDGLRQTGDAVGGVRRRFGRGALQQERGDGRARGGGGDAVGGCAHGVCLLAIRT